RNFSRRTFRRAQLPDCVFLQAAWAGGGPGLLKRGKLSSGLVGATYAAQDPSQRVVGIRERRIECYRSAERRFCLRQPMLANAKIAEGREDAGVRRRRRSFREHFARLVQFSGASEELSQTAVGPGVGFVLRSAVSQT